MDLNNDNDNKKDKYDRHSSEGSSFLEQQNNNNENNNTNHNINNNNEAPISGSTNKYKIDENQREEIFQKNQKLRNYANYAYGFCAGGAVISFVIAILGILLNLKTITTISKYLIAFGFISMLIFLFGIWALYQYIKFISEESEEHADQSSKREFLNLFIYLTIILLFIFFILAIGSLAYKKEAESYVTALGQNQSEWTKVFGNIKYSDVERNLHAIIISVGTFAVTMIILIGTILVSSYFILNSYRFTQTLVQFFCLIFFIIGSILLYISIYADRYKEISSANKSMPDWVPITLLVSAALTIIIAIGGYWAIQFESKNYTKNFCIVTSLFTALILAFSVYAFIYSGEFKDMFDGKCKQILDLLPEDFLVKYAGCSRKYVSTSHVEPSDCPKERILLAWDIKQKNFEQMQKNSTTSQLQQIPDVYGCYDNLCCTAAYNTISSKSNYLALIAIFLFITGLICSLGSYKVYDDLDDGDQKSADQLNIYSNSNKVIFALSAAVVITIIVALSTLPEKPQQDPNIVPVNPSNKTSIDADMIIKPDLNKTVKNETKTKNEEIKQETKIDEKKDCGSSCPVLRYSFELASEDGIFKKNETADFKNVTIKQDGKVGNKYVVKFESGPENLDNFTQFFEFVHNCPMLPSSIDLKISGEVKTSGSLNATTTAFMQNKIKKISNKNKESTKQPATTSSNADSNSNIVTTVNQTSTKDSVNVTISAKVVDYSKLKVGDKFDVMNKTLDFSFVNSEQTQIIRGQVYRRIDLKTLVPIQDAQVTIKNLDFAQCSTYNLKTDIKGNFNSPKLYIFKEGLTSKFQVIIFANGLTQYKKTVATGGIGAPSVIDLGKIELWSPSMLENANISATVLDSVNNYPLEGVKVSVYQGFINIDNEKVDDKSQHKDVHSGGFIQPSNQQTGENNDKNSQQLNEGQLQNYKIYLQNETDYEGFYEAKDLSPNLYTLIFEKEGYYREILSKPFKF